MGGVVSKDGKNEKNGLRDPGNMMMIVYLGIILLCMIIGGVSSAKSGSVAGEKSVQEVASDLRQISNQLL